MCGVCAGAFSFTVEVADWDVRAEQAGVPRALPAPAADQPDASAPSGADAAASAVRAEPSMPAVPAGSSPTDSPRSTRQRSFEALAPSAAATDADSQAAVGAAEESGPAGASCSAQVAVKQPPPPVAALDLVVKAFDTHRYCSQLLCWQHAWQVLDEVTVQFWKAELQQCFNRVLMSNPCLV